MDLDKQIQLLIDHAPQDGVTPQLVTAIAPVLKLLASKLNYSEYYIEQSLEQEWVVTTLRDRANPKTQKQVIYAFPTLQAVATASSTDVDPQVIAAPILVTHILFQLLALETVDSIVFLETPSDLNTGIEIRREDLQDLVQMQLKQNSSSRNNPFNQIPPDIA